MTVWIYTIVRNERLMLPYFIRHYLTFAHRLIFYDGRSDDGTRELISACPEAELRECPCSALEDDAFLELANTAWHEASGHADWVAWVDADEFLWHPDMPALLQTYLRDGVEIPRVHGYGMVSESPPHGECQIYDEIKTGFYSPEWNKPCLFQPHVNMVWTVGRHGTDHRWCETPPVHSPGTDIKLLHYRYLGGEYVAQRNARNWERVPDRCRARSYGTNCAPDTEQPYSTKWFYQFRKQQFQNVIP